VGAEFIEGTWGDCETDCLLSVRPLNPIGENTFARVTVVPEPGTALLMGLGLAGLATIRRS